MKIKVLLPTEVLLEKEVTKVIAEAENGSFCLLPRHIDFVASLVAGILHIETEEGEEEFFAIDEGTLVKYGSEVLVSTRNAVRGANLEELRETVEKRFRVMDERERKSRSAVARLESSLVRKFLELEEHNV